MWIATIAPIAAVESHPITAEHCSIWVTRTQSTSSPEEDWQYAVANVAIPDIQSYHHNMRQTITFLL